VIRRRPNQGFGFTLRHFIAYPPEDDQASASASSAAAAAASISGNWPQVSRDDDVEDYEGT